MFDDLISRKKEIEAKVKSYMNDEACPVCGSDRIEATFGVFVSPVRYVQNMICLDCSAKWKIVYDQNLNIIETEI
jgi:formate dehydrogenase maturation protein FdhE